MTRRMRRNGYCLVAALSIAAVVILPVVAPAAARAAGSGPCMKSSLMTLYGGCDRPAERSPRTERVSVSNIRRGSAFGFARRGGTSLGNVQLHQYASYGRTGAPAVFIELESKPVAGGKPVRMVMRCMDDETNLLFQFPGRRMSDVREKSELFYSLDGSVQKIVELSLATGGDGSVMGIWHGYRAIGFLTSLKEAQLLEMEAWDRENRHFRFGFDISSLGRVLQPLRRACGW